MPVVGEELLKAALEGVSLSKANEASLEAILSTIDRHRIECGERFKSLQGLVLKVAVAIIGLLITLLGFMIKIHFQL